MPSSRWGRGTSVPSTTGWSAPKTKVTTGGQGRLGCRWSSTTSAPMCCIALDCSVDRGNQLNAWTLYLNLVFLGIVPGLICADLHTAEPASWPLSVAGDKSFLTHLNHSLVLGAIIFHCFILYNIFRLFHFLMLIFSERAQLYLVKVGRS